MKIRSSVRIILFLFCGICFAGESRAQFLVEMIDTTAQAGKGLWALYQKSDRLQIGGYFQPQFQAAGSKGARNFSGGDFPKFSANRFMIRRGRLRFDYAHFNEAGLPQVQVVFQFEGSEKGVAIRDFWGRYYENKWQLFSFTMGMFARPFGYELNLASSLRESPERGRMSQILMKTERDLGFMATLEPRKRASGLKLLKVDVGVFNGQGLAGTEEYDSYKDLIGRVSFKPLELSKRVSLTGGLSLFEGGVAQATKYLYHPSGKSFLVDSAQFNIGRKEPRRYRGLDAQLKIKHAWGFTQVRAEYWWGTQTGTADESLTPASLLNEPYYVRNFRGAFVYFLQNILNASNQVGVKYDFYDPNTRINGSDIGIPGSNTHGGDIQYNTVGFGYIHLVNAHMKIMIWYDLVKNEHTAITGYEKDIRDNILTCRIQLMF